jgi:hypothetical protein
MLILMYDPGKFDFTGWAKSVLGTERLDLLHELGDPVRFSTYVDRLNYRAGQLKQQAQEIKRECKALMDEVIAPVVGEIKAFQFPPSFRCHLSGAGTASSFHRDGDPKYGIAPDTINVWIPLTKVYGNNSIYIEMTRGAGNYQPVSLVPGELLLFDACHLTHGSYSNDTAVSRVSFDIRFVPKDPRIASKLGLYAN